MPSTHSIAHEIRNDFGVPFTHRLLFDRDVLDPANPLVDAVFTRERDDAPPAGMIAVIDQGLADARPGIQEAISKRFSGSALPELREIILIPGGEACKNDPSIIDRILEAVERHRIDRRSYVAIFGGGAVLDAAGFAASTAHRGVRIVRFASTVLSQLDAAIGVKNGVNRFEKKNFIGSFDVPTAVICDEAMLDSLDRRVWREGFSEAVKIACLQDASFFDAIADSADLIREGDLDAARPIIRRCAKMHLDHIADGGDPFERLEARPLDFGHWSAHRLESMSGFDLNHGEAVAIGICLDSTYSHLIGRLDKAAFERIIDVMTRLGLPITHPLLSDDRLIAGLEEFREHLGGRLTITLLEEIGRGVDVHEVDLDLLRRSITHLESNASA
ncbi:MAG: 3-dehydroquinate synthase [Phycisphaerales bacterium]|jgi:3-dehydroquinate synthase|nr:3-dehydroquinate synthase [Phycisphaerales bacterium]